ncbi:hypothetical protein ACN28S_51780 [Cystobacter fuscus]
MPQPLMVLLTMASLGTTGPEETLELLRNTDALVVQNASPLEERQVLGEVSVANRTREGDAGFVLHPQLRVGTPWKVELGAGAEVHNPAGAREGTTGTLGVHAVGQLVEEQRVLPQLALRGEVLGPQGDEGVSAEPRCWRRSSSARHGCTATWPIGRPGTHRTTTSWDSPRTIPSGIDCCCKGTPTT